MKKILSSVSALFLCLALLAGCGSLGASLGSAAEQLQGLFQPESGRADILPFSEMEYSRPKTDKLKAAVEAVEAALDSGEKQRRVIELLDQCYAEYNYFITMYVLADIRSCQDCVDVYYAEEYDWCSDKIFQVQQLMEELYYACAASPLAGKLEASYFWEGFAQEYGDDDEVVFSDDSVELMQRENELVSQYRTLVSDPYIEIDGEVVNLAEYRQAADYYDYYRSSDLYYQQYNPQLSEIYIELVGVRHDLAAASGYDSYEQMQYDYFFDRDYGPQQADAYVEDIKAYFLPLYREVMAQSPYDTLDYGYLSEDELIYLLQDAAESMGGEIAEAFSFMKDYGLYDTHLSSRKADMSFQTYIPGYEAPFLFLSPYEDMEDVLTFAHEFGHYVDAYVNYNAYETTDLAECYSQSMEFLVLQALGETLTGDEMDALRKIHLLDILELYVQQASFAEFEKRVYETPREALSAEYLNQLSLELAKDYGYYDGGSELYYAMSWIDVNHFFEQPFYVISYPVSMDIAMQIFQLEQASPGAGLEKFLELLPRDSGELIQTAEAAGLSSPFAQGRVANAAEALGSLLTLAGGESGAAH